MPGIIGAIGLTHDSTAWISVSHTTRFSAHLSAISSADSMAEGSSTAGIRAPMATSQISTRYTSAASQVATRLVQSILLPAGMILRSGSTSQLVAW
ncbi:Uncharacterised protein [Achromobacter ruhlandii]|nr:Uncharacterised protein [Achromobacter ruhlandii]